MKEEELKALVGLEVEEARKLVEGKHHMQFQILSREGCPIPYPKDFRRIRVGVNVTKGKVTSAANGASSVTARVSCVSSCVGAWPWIGGTSFGAGK